MCRWGCLEMTFDPCDPDPAMPHLDEQAAGVGRQLPRGAAVDVDHGQLAQVRRTALRHRVERRALRPRHLACRVMMDIMQGWASRGTFRQALCKARSRLGLMPEDAAILQ